jgi:hypothetical protein
MPTRTLEKRGQSSAAHSGLDIRALRDGFGLTQTEFAHMGGFHPRTVQLWETGTEPRGASLKTLREFERLLAALRRYWDSPAALGGWLKAPNELWGGTRPVDLIVSGQVDSIWRLLYAWDEGDMS